MNAPATALETAPGAPPVDCAALARRFRDMLERDRAAGRLAHDWMVAWPSGESHRDRLPIAGAMGGYDDFRAYVCRLLEVNWPHYRRFDLEAARISHQATRALYERLDIAGGRGFDLSEPTRVDHYNAEDYFFQTLYPRPERNRIRHVLDFGAGYGRQANIWTGLGEPVIYCAIDAMERSYCTQHIYLKALAGLRGLPFVDYLDGPQEISMEAGILHMPTWLLDGLPDGSIDLAMCCHVLPEISTELLRHLVGELARLLAPGAVLYVRDHDRSHMPGHGPIDTDELLRNAGFVLEFRPYLNDGIDTWSIPRVWRRLDPKVPPRQISPEGLARYQALNKVV